MFMKTAESQTQNHGARTLHTTIVIALASQLCLVSLQEKAQRDVDPSAPAGVWATSQP